MIGTFSSGFNSWGEKNRQNIITITIEPTSTEETPVDLNQNSG